MWPASQVYNLHHNYSNSSSCYQASYARDNSLSCGGGGCSSAGSPMSPIATSTTSPIMHHHPQFSNVASPVASSVHNSHSSLTPPPMSAAVTAAAVYSNLINYYRLKDVSNCRLTAQQQQQQQPQPSLPSVYATSLGENSNSSSHFNRLTLIAN